MEQTQKRKRGKRAGRSNFLKKLGKDDRPSALKTSLPITPNAGSSSATAAIASAAKYFSGAAVSETAATHVVPRKSLTDKLMLNIGSPDIEVEPIVTRQLDKRSGKLVTTTNNRVTWRSDRNLLRRNNPFEDKQDYKREGAIREGQNTRKYIARLPKVEQPEEKVIGFAIDDLDTL